MKVKVKHVDGMGRKVRRKPPVYHAFVEPIRKGVWYLDVDFTVRTEVFSYSVSGDKPYHLEIYFETAEDIYTIVEIESDEKMKFEVFASIQKTHYRGIIIDQKMVHKAIERYTGC